MFSKKMIALMVLMIVLVAGVATAGDAGFKVYGKLHISLDYLNNSEDGQLALASNTSRFGFKGSSEMNENFTFIWQFENAINISDKNNEFNLANRNSFLGLKGNWGTFLAGIHDTPFKTLGRKVTFFKDEIGDFRTMTYGWDRRLDNVLLYALPKLGGFGAQLAYQLDQNDRTDYTEEVPYKSATAFSGLAHYSINEFFIGVAYEMLSEGNVMVFPAPTKDGHIGYGEAQSGIRGAAKYDGEKFAISALFQSLSNVMGYDGVSSTTFGGEAKFKATPKWAVKAGYYVFDPNTDGESKNDDAGQLAIGVDHTFAKDMWFYAQYAMITNGDDASWALGDGNGHGRTVEPSEAGKSPTGFSVGMAKKF